MNTTSYDQRVLIEQLRYLETMQPLAVDTEADPAGFAAHSDFDARLWQRAKHLVERNELAPALERAAKLTRHAHILMLLLVTLLGALATVYALDAGETVNIYWLLLVLLGFNLLSMLLWLAGIGLNLEGLMAGVLARALRQFPAFLKPDSRRTAQADLAWLNCQFRGEVGKWRLSGITHQLWLAYLLSGTAVLVLVLMARQYDFVWGTTLLNDAAFMRLTELLSTPLHALGFTTPTPDQVQATRIGAAQALTAEHRSSWAQFLLGALLCFGILPRLLLWAVSALMLGVARRRFTLDHYLPYYIHLRRQLLPLAGHGQVVDADLAPPSHADIPTAQPVTQPPPAGTRWVAVELGEDTGWPPPFVAADADLGQVRDRDSLARIQQRLRTETSPILAVAVAAGRTPDRGLQRSVAAVVADTRQAWLVILQGPGQSPMSDSRLAAWYRLAQACRIPAEQVITRPVDWPHA